MKKPTRRVIASLGAAVSVILGLGGLYRLYDLYRPRTFYDTGITDAEYIAITNQTVEAQQFQQKYPNTTIFVDRRGALAVDYRVEMYQENRTVRYLRLRIFIDWRTNQPADKFIDCSGTFIRKHLVEYLKTEECLTG
jgi:hypothetical protein